MSFVAIVICGLSAIIICVKSETLRYEGCFAFQDAVARPSLNTTELKYTADVKNHYTECYKKCFDDLKSGWVLMFHGSECACLNKAEHKTLFKYQDEFCNEKCKNWPQNKGGKCGGVEVEKKKGKIMGFASVYRIREPKFKIRTRATTERAQHEGEESRARGDEKKDGGDTGEKKVVEKSKNLSSGKDNSDNSSHVIFVVAGSCAGALIIVSICMFLVIRTLRQRMKRNAEVMKLLDKKKELESNLEATTDRSMLSVAKSTDSSRSASSMSKSAESSLLVARQTKSSESRPLVKRSSLPSTKASESSKMVKRSTVSLTKSGESLSSAKRSASPLTKSGESSPLVKRSVVSVTKSGESLSSAKRSASPLTKSGESSPLVKRSVVSVTKSGESLSPVKRSASQLPKSGESSPLVKRSVVSVTKSGESLSSVKRSASQLPKSGESSTLIKRSAVSVTKSGESSLSGKRSKSSLPKSGGSSPSVNR